MLKIGDRVSLGTYNNGVIVNLLMTESGYKRALIRWDKCTRPMYVGLGSLKKIKPKRKFPTISHWK